MSGSGFFASPAYKKTMSKVYGIGAAVVLAGALFKIQHYNGAGFMLLVGMGTEIVIFFLSAFEPPHEMPDWSLVYPELVGLEPRERGGGYGGGGGLDLNTLVQSGQIDNTAVQQLGEGLQRLSQTAYQLSNLSDATLATEAYLQNMKNASQSVGELSAIQTQTASNLQQSAEALSASYVSTAKAVADSGMKFADDLSASGAGFVDTLKASGQQLVNSYQALGENMKRQIEKVATDGAKYTEELAGANKNLSAINAVYELQLSTINTQVKASQDLTKELETINQHMNQSVSDVEVYKKEVAKLSQTLGELNTIYGNMLSAMNVGGQK